MRLSESFVASLKFVVDLKKNKLGPLLSGQLSILKDDQEELCNWIKLIIFDHELFANFSDHIEAALAKLEDAYWPELIEWSVKQFNADPDNKLVELVLFEAKHYSFLPTQYQSLELNGYTQRYFDPTVIEAWAISFEVNDPVHRNAMGINEYSFFRWQNEISIHEEDSRTFMKDESGELIEFELGGYIPGLEAKGINRLITLDPVPSCLPVNDLKSLTLGFDIDKVFWTLIDTGKPVYYQHDNEGMPTVALNDIDSKSYEYYSSAPIKRTKVLLYKLPTRYLHHESGNNWRIGGSPFWWQEPVIPNCIKCGKAMSFLANIPSGDLISVKNKGTYYGSDGGTAYGWWCDKDKISSYTWQDT